MATITAKTCDRCGQEMKYAGWTSKLRNVFKKGKKIRIYKTYNGNPSGYDYSEACYELCADCTKKLVEFLKGKGECQLK